MSKNNRRPQLHEDQKPDRQRANSELDEKQGDPTEFFPEQNRIDEKQQGQVNKERSGEKSSGTGDETLGIP